MSDKIWSFGFEIGSSATKKIAKACDQNKRILLTFIINMPIVLVGSIIMMIGNIIFEVSVRISSLKMHIMTKKMCRKADRALKESMVF